VCSESGLPDDLSWGRLGYIRWLDTAQDLCHSKETHPLDHTDFTGRAEAGAAIGVVAPGLPRMTHPPSVTGRRYVWHWWISRSLYTGSGTTCSTR